MSRTLALCFVAVAGCGLPVESEEGPRATSSFSLTLPAADAAAVLALVNYPGSDITRLDSEAGLDRRAAEGIVAHRNGLDGVSPSADDDLFDTVGELDMVAWVGDAAFVKLAAFAATHPAPAGQTVEGVDFTGWQAEAVVWGVNHASLIELDVTVGLNARAAGNLVSGAPFSSVEHLGAVSQVGGQALLTLRGSAARWWGLMHGAAPVAGTFDGVVFDAAAAPVALSIANEASAQQLVAHQLTSTTAGHLVAGRPYASLAAVAAVSGVGTATMQALHAYAVSGRWPEQPECSLDLGTRVDADIADLTELLRLATTSDWPFAEALALEFNTCRSLDDAGTRDFVFEEIAGGAFINWGYEPRIYPEGDDFARGGTLFVAMVDLARQVIDERVLEGRWAPADAHQQALYARLPAIQASLTAGPRANPAAYYETVLTHEASECSQSAAVLVDPATNKVWILHRFPGC